MNNDQNPEMSAREPLPQFDAPQPAREPLPQFDAPQAPREPLPQFDASQPPREPLPQYAPPQYAPDPRFAPPPQYYGAPAYQPAPPEPYDPQIEADTDQAFSKGLAAAIMAGFPIASIIAIFFGSKALGLVDYVRTVCAARGRRSPGKLIPAKILGKIGKIAGIVMTVFWAVEAVYFFLILLLTLTR